MDAEPHLVRAPGPAQPPFVGIRKKTGRVTNPYESQINIPGSKGILEKGFVYIYLGYYAAAEQVPARRVALLSRED